VQYPNFNLSASSGTPPYQWSGTLPAGLTLSPAGVVYGTPSTTGGPFNVTLVDAANQSAMVTTSIPIAAALIVTNTCGANGCAVEYACVDACGQYGTQSGGVPPYQYVLTKGTMPPKGTSLNGLSISGPISTSGQFSVDVVDSIGATQSLYVIFNVFGHLSLSAGSGGGFLPNGPATVRMPLATYAPTKITLVTINEGPKYSVIPGSVTYDGVTLTFQIAGSWVGSTQPPFSATVYDNYLCSPGAYCSSTNTVNLSMG
jgi:hypothetical protein